MPSTSGPVETISPRVIICVAVLRRTRRRWSGLPVPPGPGCRPPRRVIEPFISLVHGLSLIATADAAPLLGSESLVVVAHSVSESWDRLRAVPLAFPGSPARRRSTRTRGLDGDHRFTCSAFAFVRPDRLPSPRISRVRVAGHLATVEHVGGVELVGQRARRTRLLPRRSAPCPGRVLGGQLRVTGSRPTSAWRHRRRARGWIQQPLYSAARSSCSLVGSCWWSCWHARDPLKCGAGSTSRPVRAGTSSSVARALPRVRGLDGPHADTRSAAAGVYSRISARVGEFYGCQLRSAASVPTRATRAARCAAFDRVVRGDGPVVLRSVVAERHAVQTAGVGRLFVSGSSA